MSVPKKIYTKTFGCQMNVYDTARMTELLAPMGFVETQSMEEADVVLLNTCHIRDKAVEKVYSDLGRIRDVKAERRAAGKDTIITVAGCVAQAEGAEIARREPSVNLVVGPQSYHRLGDLIARTTGETPPIVETEFPELDKFASLPKRAPARAPSAFLTVQEGCDRFCTFCVVPYTRGAEYSRSIADVESEARRLVDHGVREITLLGQNVNAYHGQGPDGRPWSLARLIGQLARIGGLERLRYTTSHPRDMADDLIDAHRDEAKLMPFLHLPFQSGADRVLAAMNRKHTGAEYLALVDRIRAVRPDIALSTDVIVGFPGETDAEFEDTLSMMERVRLRPGLQLQIQSAAGHTGRRARSSSRRGQGCTSKRCRRDNPASNGVQFSAGRHDHAGAFDRRGRRPGQLIGRSPYLQSVHAQLDSSWLGKILEVEIASAGPNSLAGVIPEASAA